MRLHSFLDQKPLFYDVIDYARMPRVYARIASQIKIPKIIHVVGTNGKGTTGRFLAQMLTTFGLHVGHYSSPHIECFNERIWIDGILVNDAVLENAHMHLLGLLEPEEAHSLSYFEYTTLLCMLIFSLKCDYVVLEAGLGGEYDATNVFPKILSIITPIGYDHQAFLGESIEAIASTKLNSITTDFILARQKEMAVDALAKHTAESSHVNMVSVDSFLDEKCTKSISSYASHRGYPSFLQENLRTAVAALTFLGYDINLDSIDLMTLQGRYELFLPNVRVDVGHNPMAARALLEAVGLKKVILVYNSYADKEVALILEILRPIIERLEIIPIESSRAMKHSDLVFIAQNLGLDVRLHEKTDPAKEYVVFGSFSVVEAFRKGQRER
jgi:dihydrofolate synthase / folylpolyglutamate synthase